MASTTTGMEVGEAPLARPDAAALGVRGRTYR